MHFHSHITCLSICFARGEGSCKSVVWTSQANEVHVKLRDTTRALMATASELSLYKVTVLECEQAYASLKTQVRWCGPAAGQDRAARASCMVS